MNNAVNVGLGLKKFVFYVLLSAALGIATDFIIQKKLQSYWGPVAEKLRQAGLVTSSPRMVYSRTGLPVFGAQLDHVRFEKNIKCFRGSIQVSQVFMPFSVYQLLSKKVKLGKVDVQKLELQLIEADNCIKNAKDAEAAGAPVETIEQVAEKVVNRALDKAGRDLPAWFGHLDKWFSEHSQLQAKNPLTSLVVREMSITAKSLEGKEISAQGKADLEFDENVNASVSLKPLILRKKEKSLPTEFRANISANSENIHLFGDWGFHEGHVILDVNYDKSEKIKVNFKTQDLPVSALNRWLDTTWSFQFLWFNCNVGLEAQKDEWVQAPWNFDGCRMNGPHGTVTLLDKQVNSLKKTKELHLEIQDLNLDKIINGREDLLLSGVFKGFGKLQGKVDLQNEKWTGQFTLNNAQVVFSANDHRELQTVDQISLEAAYSSGLYSLSVVSAELHGGQFDGKMSVEYNDHEGRGKGMVAVKALSFENEIEELMLAGQASPIEIRGTFELGRRGHLDKADGLVNVSQFRGKNMDVDGAKILAEWVDDSFRSTVVANQVKVFKDGAGQWIYSSLLDRAPSTESLVLTGTHASINYVEGMYVMDNLAANYGGLRAKAQGQRRKVLSSGSWEWFEKNNPVAQWKWSAVKDVRLVPLTPETREWLLKNQQFTDDHPSISVYEKGS